MTTGEPSWLPDPTGRHQHRWFDGRAFTDRVADDGATSIDPGPAAAPSEPDAPAVPVWGPAWPAPATATPAPEPPHRSRLPLVLAAVGAVLVLTGGVVALLARDDGGGTGTHDGTLAEGGAPGTHEVSLGPGDALLVTVVPDGDLDVVVGLLADDDGADAIGDLFDDLLPLQREPAADVLDPSPDAGERDQLLLLTDNVFGGEAEELLLAVDQAVDLTVVVAPFDPGLDEGDYQVVIQVVRLDVEEGADGEELLEAVEDDDDLPEAFRDVAGELLEG